MTPLSSSQLAICQAFAKSARGSALQMVTNAQSGHPGGSLSTLDFLTLVYTQIIKDTGEDIIVSNGHISPGVYGALAEMGYIDKTDVVENFRQFGSNFEGHITRHVRGVPFGTGPLGAGISVAAGYALSEKKKQILNQVQDDDNQVQDDEVKRVFATIGDGEAQEGQVYETLLFAAKEELSNFIVFVDWNKVQLTASLADIMPTDLPKIFAACGWNVINVDGHDYNQMWEAINSPHETKPTVIIGETIMGKGADFMEEAGKQDDPKWHGKAPSAEMTAHALANELYVTPEEEKILDEFRASISWQPSDAIFNNLLGKNSDINTGEPIEYQADELTDCRGAYGKALFSLAQNNKNIQALSADLRGSVMTKFVAADLPDQHTEMGICEQNMVSVSGGLSMNGFVPFCSTFGAFMSSRAKDQARLNDINQTNVKMVSTHCGLSVGEDGPTHQAIDDMGSFLGMFNTGICEPADPNQCDRIIRYIASVYGNFYMRMGRHKLPVLTHEDGSIFFDKNYEYTYGKCDVLREGTDITIVATGATVHEAFRARENYTNPEKIEIVIVSSIKQFDETLLKSLQKTKKVITCEDHNALSGLGSQVALYAMQNKIQIDEMKNISVSAYQLSGKPAELYKSGGIDEGSILECIEGMVQ